MWNALGKLAGASGDDMQTFASELQNMAGQGGFNPFSLLTGDQELFGAFMAPLSPQLIAAIEQYRTDGSGPLTAVVEQFTQQGLAPNEAATRAGQMFDAARGMLVVVMRHEQGVSTLPQLHFERVDSEFMDQVVTGLAQAVPDQTQLRDCFDELLKQGQAGARFPALVAGADGQSADAFWEDLSEQMLEGIDEGILPGQEARLGDLGHWIAAAIEQLCGDEPDGHELLVIARCQLLAGDIAKAVAAIEQLLSDFEPEDEETLRLVEALVKAAIANGEPQRAAACLVDRWADLEAIFGGPCYEAALARVRCLAAAQADAGQLIAAVELLQGADRKAFRHDLNREPLWLVVGDEPGELLETAEAADRIGRSINFVAKRLEQATIPVYNDGEQLRIPAQALDVWRQVMEHFSLLD